MDLKPVRGDVGVADAVAASADYRALIERLKQRVRESQARAARAVNRELVMLYWSIGREILQQQQASGWGDDVVGRISTDLTADMGGARGFSRRNLFYMRRLASLWTEPGKVPPVVAQIGWSHNRLALHRVYAPIAVSTWQTDRPASTLPPVEVSEDVPADLSELAELEGVRARLIERVAHHQAPHADTPPD